MFVEYMGTAVNARNSYKIRVFKKSIMFTYGSENDGTTFQFSSEEEAKKAYQVVMNGIKEDKKFISLD